MMLHHLTKISFLGNWSHDIGRMCMSSTLNGTCNQFQRNWEQLGQRKSHMDHTPPFLIFTRNNFVHQSETQIFMALWWHCTISIDLSGYTSLWQGLWSSPLTSSGRCPKSFPIFRCFQVSGNLEILKLGKPTKYKIKYMHYKFTRIL